MYIYIFLKKKTFLGTELTKDPSWKDPEIVPEGFLKLLAWIKEEYDNPLVYITENGIGDKTGTLNDTHRSQFIEVRIADKLNEIYLY